MKPLAALLLLVVAGCSSPNPLYCLTSADCTDPARPFCDLEGVYPASEGHGRTCIASPFPLDGGVPDAPTPDAAPDADLTPDAGCVENDTRPCGTDVGACELGTETCRSGAWDSCQGGAGPASETCNTVDDDCDSVVDNGSNGCGGACPLAGAPGTACDGGDGDLCAEGTWICTDINSATCGDSTGTLVEECNAMDDDCDLSIDEGCSCVNGTMQTCGTDVGACTIGSQTCALGMWGSCSGTAPAAETCNDADDNCDGSTDEPFFDKGNPCSAGVGACLATGMMVCAAGGTVTECSATPGMSTPEMCNDIDDDCDGVVDNGCPATPIARFPWNGFTTGSPRANGTLPFGKRNPLHFLLRWDSVVGATSYDFELTDLCATPGFATCIFPDPPVWYGTTTSLTWTSSPSYIAAPLMGPAGTRWYWRVRACNAIGCSDWSPVRYFDHGRLGADFNGDGYSDVLVGAPELDLGGVGEGGAFLYVGSSSGLGATYTARFDNPLNQPGADFGLQVASLGDVNGDGYSDAIIGAPNQDYGAIDEGMAYVYYGSASGLSTSIALDNPDNEAGAQFGAVAGAGDLNGDGFMDVVVGAPLQGAADEGKVYVYYGAAAGIAATPTVTLENPTAQPNGRFGFSVSSAGDVNGDGFADLVVDAPFQSSGATSEGNVFIYFGSASGIATIANIVLDSPTNQANAYFGTAIAAGDINDDSFSDLIVGAAGYDSGAIDEGNVFIYHGSASGLPSLPTTTLDSPTNQASGSFGDAIMCGDFNDDGYRDIAVGAMFQSSGAMYEGNSFVYMGTGGGVATSPMTIDNPTNQAYGRFGDAVGGGDFNGNGYADLAIGASHQTNPIDAEGNVFYLSSTTAGVPVATTVTIDSPDNQIASYFGSAVSTGPAGGN